MSDDTEWSVPDLLRALRDAERKMEHASTTIAAQQALLIEANHETNVAEGRVVEVEKERDDYHGKIVALNDLLVELEGVLAHVVGSVDLNGYIAPGFAADLRARDGLRRIGDARAGTMQGCPECYGTGREGTGTPSGEGGEDFRECFRCQGTGFVPFPAPPAAPKAPERGACDGEGGYPDGYAEKSRHDFDPGIEGTVGGLCGYCGLPESSHVATLRGGGNE